MRTLKAGFITAVALSMLLYSGNLFNNTTFAQTVWVKGMVTKAPWVDRHYRIGIDGIVYTFMPEIGISFPDVSRPKVSGGERAAFIQRIQVKQPVAFRAQGHRIYEIMIDR